ncbi:MAG: putative endopeptidase LytF, partial [Streblomastix strix]
MTAKSKAVAAKPKAEGEIVSEDELKKFGWKNTSSQAVSDMNKTLVKYEINTNNRVRHFLSQVAKESELGTYCKELGDEKYCSKYDKDTNKGKQLGNTEDGDGYKFKGSGYIQVTGRYNYQKFADHINDQKVMDGFTYTSVKYPWEITGYWWKMNNMNAVCDKSPTVESVTKIVNGGQTGIEERKNLRDFKVGYCSCPTEISQIELDARKDGLCNAEYCAVVITETTPITTCPCPTDSAQLDKDPRKDELCKDQCQDTIGKTNTQCKCKDQDQRDVCQEGYCNNITEETPIDACPCPEDKNELKND